jgi:pimeloyl-ACP methyl ester carboxylesterase
MAYNTPPMLKRIAAQVGVLYALLCIGLFALQRSLLYFPSHHTSPSVLTAWQVEGEVVGFAREVSHPKTVWLMMHGNAGQASDREYVLRAMQEEDALYVLEYPGYGARAGSPTQQSINGAATEAYRALRQKYPSTPIGVVGESLGSGPASMLASEPQPPEAIVLITPFDSLYNVAAKRFWFVPVSVLLADRWDNVASLKSYRGTLTIFGARDDEVIPIAHAKKLANSNPIASFTEIPGGHNDWSFCDEVKIAR